jgi:hypothetical protein
MLLEMFGRERQARLVMAMGYSTAGIEMGTFDVIAYLDKE